MSPRPNATSSGISTSRPSWTPDDKLQREPRKADSLTENRPFAKASDEVEIVEDAVRESDTSSAEATVAVRAQAKSSSIRARPATEIRDARLVARDTVKVLPTTHDPRIDWEESKVTSLVALSFDHANNVRLIETLPLYVASLANETAEATNV